MTIFVNKGVRINSENYTIDLDLQNVRVLFATLSLVTMSDSFPEANKVLALKLLDAIGDECSANGD